MHTRDANRKIGRSGKLRRRYVNGTGNAERQPIHRSVDCKGTDEACQARSSDAARKGKAYNQNPQASLQLDGQPTTLRRYICASDSH